MRKKFTFSLLTTTISLFFALLFARLSLWQWERHQEKLAYIAKMQARLEQEIVPINELLSDTSNPTELIYRRVFIKGRWDFKNEMLLKNRKVDDQPGVFLLTPLKITGSDLAIIVNRGFIPLKFANSKRERERFQKEEEFSAVILLKEAKEQRWLAPADPPTGGDAPFVESWLRVDLKKISLQLPYKIISVYGEIIINKDLSQEDLEKLLIRSDSNKADILFLGEKKIASAQNLAGKFSEENLPIPTFDPVIPAGRHLGYVFEWGFLALIALAIGFILQIKRGE
ncbi:MAG TPA: SURF1 family protein [Oligoflexia bacterium]|nr:SURF1 family protein [Oligoflexia bacterium]HMP26963.1 SURF1 family protein [Oligoflexia bacterium]